MTIETGWFSYAVIGAFCSESRLSALCVKFSKRERRGEHVCFGLPADEQE
ncbi:hypothetical protein [Rhodosalinus sp. FB01]